MKILFVVGHPAHVHLFKNVVRRLGEHGHQILVGAVAREVTTYLLDAFAIRYVVFGSPQPELLSKGLGMIPKDLLLLHHAKQFGPDVIVSTGSPYAAHVSAVLDKPHLAFGDTEHATLIARLMMPFTDAVCTPDVFEGDLGPKHVRYRGYKELAYVHPKYFRPNPGVLDRIGLSPKEPYVLLRFSSWDASHDLGDRGFHFADVRGALAFVKELEAIGRVVVTSDRKTLPQLDAYALSIPAEWMHDVIAFAQLYVGEGATMAAEAGVLGVPWIFVSTRGRGFLSDQQSHYGLGYWVQSIEAARLVLPRVSGPVVREEWKQRRDRMLMDKEDVVAFISNFVETWNERSGGVRNGGVGS
jgi:predicted glycosyltransferase